MAERYDLCVARPRKDGKVYWHKIGVAFPSRSGEGFDLSFDSLPVPEWSQEYGLQVRAKLFPAKPRDGQGGGGGQSVRSQQSHSEQHQAQRDAQAPLGSDLDDEIPFS